MSLTHNAQPAILTVMTCAEAIPFADAIKIVYQRGKFMQEAIYGNTGKMLAIKGKKIDSAYIAGECVKESNAGRSVVISNYNSPNELVISGHVETLNRMEEKIIGMGMSAVPLKVSAPFHSPLMKSAALKLDKVLEECNFKAPRWPIISNVSALPYRGKDEIAELYNKMYCNSYLY